MWSSAKETNHQPPALHIERLVTFSIFHPYEQGELRYYLIFNFFIYSAATKHSTLSKNVIEQPQPGIDADGLFFSLIRAKLLLKNVNFLLGLKRFLE